MMLFSAQIRKTLRHAARDYQAGLFLKNDTESNTETNARFSYAYTLGECFEPGDVVPLNGNGTKPNQNVSDDDYKNETLFSPAAKVFEVSAEDVNESGDFAIHPFGIAVDYVSPVVGKVQTAGYVWVPFEDVPELDEKKFVILRKNHRYGGKPYLQAAPAGTAEIIRTDTRTRADGRIWGLIHLGKLAHTPLFRITASETIEPGTKIFSRSPTFPESKLASTTRQIVPLYSPSEVASYRKDYVTLDFYDPEKENFVRALPLQGLQLESKRPDNGVYGNYIYNRIEEADGTLIGFDDNFTQKTQEKWPEYVRSATGLQPFLGGLFRGYFSSETELTVLGRTLTLSKIFTYEKGIDIWPGDFVTVKIEPGQENDFEILNCPKDDPVGTVQLIVQGDRSRFSVDRGWQVEDLPTFNDTSTIGTFSGSVLLTPSYEHYHHNYADGSKTGFAETPDSSDPPKISFEPVFGGMQIARKVQAGIQVPVRTV